MLGWNLSSLHANLTRLSSFWWLNAGRRSHLLKTSHNRSPVSAEENEKQPPAADNMTRLYNLLRLVLPNSMKLTCPHCWKVSLNKWNLASLCERGAVQHRQNDILWNVIVTGDKGRRWGYFDQREIASPLGEENTSTEETFQCDVKQDEGKLESTADNTPDWETSRLYFSSQMTEWGFNAIPPVMTITF